MSNNNQDTTAAGQQESDAMSDAEETTNTEKRVRIRNVQNGGFIVADGSVEANTRHKLGTEGALEVTQDGPESATLFRIPGRTLYLAVNNSSARLLKTNSEMLLAQTADDFIGIYSRNVNRWLRVVPGTADLQFDERDVETESRSNH